MINHKEIINAFCVDFSPIIESIATSLQKLDMSGQEALNDQINKELNKANSLLRQLKNYKDANSFITMANDKREVIASGFKSLDKPLGGGFYRGDVISLWAKPIMGMTAFLLSSAYYMAKHGSRVLFISEQNSENWMVPRLKASLKKLNFELENISLYFETVQRFEDNTLEKLCEKHALDIIVIDTKTGIQEYNIEVIKNLKLLARKKDCAIIIGTTVGLYELDVPLKNKDLWKRDSDKLLFDISDVVLTIYRRIWSLESEPPQKTGDSVIDNKNKIRWKEEVDYYKQRIDVDCFKNSHGESFWKRHFYYADCAFVLDKIPVRKYDDTI